MLFIISDTNGQEIDVATIGFYNLENLFDTIDTEDVKDTEFTPTGRKNWTIERYREKIDHMAFVVSKMGLDINKEGMTILGVAEIENRSVLEDLIAHPRLVNRNYNIIHYDSHDFRGIDVALIYNPNRFEVLYSDTLPLVMYRDGKRRYTRDILYVKGVMDTDTFHIMVNHWPSRRGGARATAPFRNEGARVCKQVVDSLYAISPNDKFIIMGDLNDDPTSPSVKKVLNAKRKLKQVEEGGLYNPFANMYRRGQGSNAYRDNWSLFDQVIISESLLDSKQSGYFFHKARVFNKDFLINKSGKYKGYPARTFSGDKYISGYSDHFPTLIYLYKNKSN